MLFSIKKRNISNQKGLFRSSGFTLIEMLVVLAIFVVVTGIILANLPDFKSSTNLDLVTQQVSLYIRGAQVYAVGSIVQTPAQQFPAYGIFLNTVASPTGFGNSKFIMFGDDPAQTNLNYYDGGGACTPGTGECVELYNLPKGYVISGIKSCLVVSGNWQNPVCTDRQSVAIVFKRPESQAYFYCGANSVCQDDSINSQSVNITIKSVRDNKTRNISVMGSGQIVVSSTASVATP